MITPGLSIAIGVLLLGSVGRLPHQVRKAVSTAAAEVLQSFCKTRCAATTEFARINERLTTLERNG